MRKSRYTGKRHLEAALTGLGVRRKYGICERDGCGKGTGTAELFFG